MLHLQPSPLQEWTDDLFREQGVQVWVKRDDLIHPVVGGNKIRKLKGQLTASALVGKKGILTFGGVVSNHLVATTYLAKTMGIPIRTLIRGEQVSNPILQLLKQWGAEMQFLSRQSFDEALKSSEPDWLTIPLGGTHPGAFSGVGEIVDEIRSVLPAGPFHICVPLGSGGTAAGLASKLSASDQLHIYPAIKGPALDFQVKAMFDQMGVSPQTSIHVINNAARKGFARRDDELWSVLRALASKTGMWWDPVYNGKMVVRFLEQVKQRNFPSGARIVLLHTGGLPGLIGYRDRFKLTDMPNLPAFPGQ